MTILALNFSHSCILTV